MLVFFIHGVSTRKSNYADSMIVNIKKSLKKIEPSAKSEIHESIKFYSGFWGNLFNNKKQQTIDCIQKDFSRACEKHKEYKGMHRDIYRYQKQRSQMINDFLGDFLIYQNSDRGKTIRQAILDQFSQCLKDHPDIEQVHFVAHSLGSFILWDLLFSKSLKFEDPAFQFREKLNRLTLGSITTLGSPLLFLKQMLDLDFSVVNHLVGNSDREVALRWVNIIHSSDIVAYPLKAAIEEEIGPKLLFFDQYVWQDANAAETAIHIGYGQSDLAMVVAAEDAHSSYFQSNLDGQITARLIVYNLLGDTEQLTKRCVTPK